MSYHQSKDIFQRRCRRARVRLAMSNKKNRPRLSIFRSSQHIYAQIIDDMKGVTLLSASTLDSDIRSAVKKGGDCAAAAAVGTAVAQRALEAGIQEVVFDRGGYLFHGRVKSLAEAARQKGLSF